MKQLNTYLLYICIFMTIIPSCILIYKTFEITNYLSITSSRYNNNTQNKNTTQNNKITNNIKIKTTKNNVNNYETFINNPRRSILNKNVYKVKSNPKTVSFKLEPDIVYFRENEFLNLEQMRYTS